MLAFLGALPQILLAMLLLLQGRDTASDKMQSHLGLLAAAVFLFWALIGCTVLALWRRTRPLAGALTWGSFAGFLLTVIVTLST
jgi:presenilin-like A22 family membrane protease